MEVYTDADFAAKSTSGIMIARRSGDAQYPLHWCSRKQSSAARSTPEAELIAMATAMFTEVMNVQSMLERLLERPVRVNCRQDNQAMVQILESGYSAKLRHAPRVHRVNECVFSARSSNRASVRVLHSDTRPDSQWLDEGLYAT